MRSQSIPFHDALIFEILPNQDKKAGKSLGFHELQEDIDD